MIKIREITIESDHWLVGIRHRKHAGHGKTLHQQRGTLRYAGAARPRRIRHMGTIRRVTRNVKRWQNGKMALRWVASGMIEAAKGFRRLKAHKQLPILRAALLDHQQRLAEKPVAPVSRAA